MRGLYEVWVVDPETEECPVTAERVFANDEVMARMKAIAGITLEKDLEAYDFIVHRVGDVRPKLAKPQEVRIVKE